MSKSLVWTIVWVLFAFNFAERVIHYFVIYPYLKHRGIHPPLHWHTNFYSADMTAYKKARLSASEPLTWWYVVRGVRMLDLVTGIGVLYLICSR
jgi:hypothetical protein